MTTISGTDTGGSSITSYSLEWDSGTGGASFTSLIGETSDNIATFTYTQTGLTAGSSYKFRYRAKNIFGWGPYSNEVTTISATRPDAPSIPTTFNTGTSVTI